MESYFATLRQVRSLLEGLVGDHTPDEILRDLLTVLKEDCGEYMETPFRESQCICLNWGSPCTRHCDPSCEGWDDPELCDTLASPRCLLEKCDIT